MKKTLTALLVGLIIISMFASIAFAKSEQSGNGPGNVNKETGDQSKEQSREQISACIQAVERLCSGFEENKLQRNQIMTATKEQLHVENQLVIGYKQEMKNIRTMLDSMTKEEYAEREQEIKSLMNQIREVQKYSLQIKTAMRTKARELSSIVETTELPTAEIVEYAAGLIDII